MAAITSINASQAGAFAAAATVLSADDTITCKSGTSTITVSRPALLGRKP